MELELVVMNDRGDVIAVFADDEVVADVGDNGELEVLDVETDEVIAHFRPYAWGSYVVREADGETEEDEGEDEYDDEGSVKLGGGAINF
jgi:hypothetical protein